MDYTYQRTVCCTLCGSIGHQIRKVVTCYLPLDMCGLTYRVLAIDVTGRKTTETPSVILCFSHKTVWQKAVISTMILETQAARNLRSSYYCVNCRCSAVTMPIRSSSYATLSASESIVFVQLPLNSMFFCHTEVLSHARGFVT